MIDAKDAIIWVNDDTKQVMVHRHGWLPENTSRFRGQHWTDPIGASYAAWHKASKKQRVELMLETTIDLAMQGFALADVLRAFAQVTEFRALGDESVPMCRALTSALIGRCLEPVTMGFEDLILTYRPDK